MKQLIQFVIFGFLISTNAHAATPTLYKGEARFVVKPESVAAFRNAVAKIIEPTLNEPGNISYEAFQVVKDGQFTNEFEFHELWISKQAMMVDHLEKTPHMKKFFETVRLGSRDGMIETFEANSHEVVGLQPQGPQQ